MAIKLSANYSKKLGLPQYTSHSFSASVEVELSDITQVEAEVQKLYQLLQHSVDQEIQHPGFVPKVLASCCSSLRVSKSNIRVPSPPSRIILATNWFRGLCRLLPLPCTKSTTPGA